MIDPHNITNYDRTRGELDEFFIFSRLVAGKHSMFAAVATDKLINESLIKYSDGPCDYPLDYVYDIDDDRLVEALTDAKTGNYCVTARCFRQIADKLRDNGAFLSDCSVDELMQIHGIGPKTARFFVLHSREYASVAVLDVHILRWLRDIGYPHVTRQTPQTAATYARIEEYFLREAYRRELSPAELDLQVWSKYNRKENVWSTG